MKSRVTVHLPKDLLGRARRRAAAQGRTLTALIEDGLQLVTAARSGEDAREVEFADLAPHRGTADVQRLERAKQLE
jgi:hypothetical protein